MGIIRKSLPLLMLAAIPALVVAVTVSNSAPAVRHAPRMSAGELANGLLFGQGPAMPYLRAVESPHPRLSVKMTSVERSVDRDLRMSPSLAGAFADDVQSGNPVRVAEALVSLSALVQPVSDREFGQSTPRINVARAEAALKNYSAQATETALDCSPGTGTGTGTGPSANFDCGPGPPPGDPFHMSQDHNYIFSDNFIYKNVIGLTNRKLPKANRLAAFQTVELIAVGLHAA